MKNSMTTKYEIEKFDGSKSFGLWRTKMRGMLVQQGLVKALMGRSKMPETMSEEEKEEMDEKALSAIQRG